MRTDTRLPRSHEGLWMVHGGWGSVWSEPLPLRAVRVLHRVDCPQRYGLPLAHTEDFFAEITKPMTTVCGYCFLKVRPGTHPLARDLTPVPRWR